MGFGPCFIATLRALYEQSTARIPLNGSLTRSFPISRGIRQGCPISPLLFDIYNEPFAQILQQDDQVIAFSSGAYKNKVALYADDLAIFTSDPVLTILRVEVLVKEFGALSQYSVNNLKTGIMCWNVPNCTGNEQNELRYLGISIIKPLEEIPQYNLERKAKEVDTLLARWKNLPLTLYGRVNLIKMVILPKLTYLFNCIPLTFPKSMIDKIQGKLVSFVCASKGAQLAWKKLRRKLEKGGVALPDLRVYCMAFQFKNCRILLGKLGLLIWGGLLEEMVWEWGSNGFLYKFGARKFFKKVRLKILKAALTLWLGVRKIFGIGYFSDFSPIWDSPGTPECLQDRLSLSLRRAGIKVWGDLLTVQGMVPWEVLVAKTGDSLSRFKYLQLSSWVAANGQEIGGMWEFESKLQNEAPRKKEVTD